MHKPLAAATPALASARPRVGLLQPLRHRRYRQLWIANFFSNLGGWVQAFAAAWLVASMSRSALGATLVQTATCAPVLLFALVAGVLADAVPRPKLLFIVNLMMALAAAAMALLVLSDSVSVGAVLCLIFAMGSGAAFMWPAWQASMSALVPPQEVEAAAALNNLSFNCAAALGPALGGLLFHWIGPAPLFVINALSFAGLLLVYRDWIGHAAAAAPAPSATLAWAGLRAGLRLGWQSAFGCPSYRHLLRHAGAMFFTSIAFAALLPLFVRDVLHRPAGVFGILMASLGGGAIAAAFLLPALRARWARRRLVAAALAVYGAVLAALPLAASTSTPAPLWLFIGLIALAGMAWSAIVTALNGAAQTAFPHALRARTLSIFLLAVAGGQTAGSLFWGALASYAGVAAALPAAGAGMLLHGALLALAPAHSGAATMFEPTGDL